MPSPDLRAPGGGPGLRAEVPGRTVRKTLFVLLAVYAAAAILAVGAHDPALYAEGRALSTTFWGAVAGRISRYGESDWLLIPTGVALLLLHVLPRLTGRMPERDISRFGRRVAFLFLAIAVTGIAAVILKYGLGHPRPSVTDAVGPIRFSMTARYASFPSGHSTTMGAFAMAATLLVPRWGKLVWLAALPIAASRVVVGAHFPSDVVAGLALGAFMVAAMAIWASRRGWLFHPGAGVLPTAEPYAFADLRADLRALLTFSVASVRRLIDTRLSRGRAPGPRSAVEEVDAP